MLNKTFRISIISIWLLLLTGCDFINSFIGNPILVVDLDAIAKATGQSEHMQKELEFANLKLTEQLKLVASQLEVKVADKKEKLSKSPTDAELKELQDYALNAQQQLANTKNIAIQQSTDFRSDLILRFRSNVREIAGEIALNSGAKLILLSNYETIWFDPSADITDEVIAIMRARTTKPVKSVSIENNNDTEQINNTSSE